MPRPYNDTNNEGSIVPVIRADIFDECIVAKVAYLQLIGNGVPQPVKIECSHHG